ncbi:MAG: hypothetical protein ACR2NZ_20225 [Rubripirellula sp.]
MFHRLRPSLPVDGKLVLVAALVWLPGLVFGQDPWPGRLGELVSSGIVIAGERVPIQSPSVDPRGQSELRMAAQEKLAGAHGWTRFSRNSVVAPVKIELAYLKNEAGDRVGHRIHVAYVVHAGIETLRDSDLMGGLFGGSTSKEAETKDPESEASKALEDQKADESFRSEQMDDATVTSLGIESQPGVGFGWLEFLLLKKVELQGVIRSNRFEGVDYVAITWELAEEFTDREPVHERFRNEWVRRDRSPSGSLIRSEATSFAGAAGYLVLSSVDGTDNACLIEAEVVLHEPEGWFNGSNLLRSKLPLILQESARRFRRGLK